MSSPREIQTILAALDAEPAALATLIGVSGSSYRQPGARCLLLPDGTRIGSISGGCLEEDVRRRAAEVLATGCPQLAVYDTATENDLVWGTGLGCQGEVHVFVERLPQPLPDWISTLRENFRLRRDTLLEVTYAGPDTRSLGTRLPHGASVPGHSRVYREKVPAPPSLVIFGAGDDAMPLERLASELGWHIVILDPRSGYAIPGRFPHAHHVEAMDAASAARHPLIDDRSHVIVMSHRYRDDVALLRSLLPRPLAYVGVLGPRQRTQRMLSDLEAEGVPIDAGTQARIHSPVGLDLGGAAPETVALSIVAELQAFLSKREPRHLRDSPLPIHG